MLIYRSQEKKKQKQKKPNKPHNSEKQVVVDELVTEKIAAPFHALGTS